jgi:hypothetical protein
MLLVITIIGILIALVPPAVQAAREWDDRAYDEYGQYENAFEDTYASPPGDPDLEAGRFGANHPGGASLLFGNGSVGFLREDVDPWLLRRMGHRDDGRLIEEGF